MNTLILVGLSVAVLLTAARRSISSQPQPEIIYVVQAAREEPTGGTGCLPLLVLAGVILLATVALR